jgi:Ca2+-transporting ATPase
MLSISQLVPNLIAKMDGTIEENADIPAIGLGIVGAIILQIVFAHVPLINQVFQTAPLTFNQWLICLAVGSPMILWAAVVNRFDPPN